MKISDRTIEGKGCIYCEQDFMATLPGLAAAYYASKFNLQVILCDDTLIGLPLEVYIPDVKLAIDLTKRQSEEAGIIHAWKKHLCNTRGIMLTEIQLDRKRDSKYLLRAVRSSFKKKDLFIQSDEEQDLVMIRRAFDSLREKKD